MEQAIYQCGECGLQYYDEATAKRCEAWCKAHQSCNLEIIQYAIKSEGDTQSR
jgi:hypothetical protein